MASNDPREPVGIGLLGYGTVGSSVDALLTARADDIVRVVGRPVSIVRALVRDASRTRTRMPSPGLLTERFEEIRDDPRISVVAEVMGGIDPTRSYISELLGRGISVVSANKQLLARHGEELWGIAERNGAQLRFEASVCAAIPVVKVLRESLLAAGVNEVIGIVNGTTNFILSAMTNEGQGYHEALARAQELGYAEPDPTEDVNGADAAAKMAILASIAFHAHVRIDQVPHEGIDTLDRVDVSFADELGYAVKLLGRAALGEDGISASVSPTLVPHGHPLARVEGSFNAVMLRGDAIREVTLQGPGAGGDETATAVIGDLLSVVGTRGTGFLQHDGYYRNLPVLTPDEAVSASYVRLAVDDLPGVLAQLAGLFGAHGISLRTVIQRPRPDGAAELVLLTHPARIGDLQDAIREVQELDCIRGATRTLRVLSE
jgi:homoserine dehydrogenase